MRQLSANKKKRIKWKSRKKRSKKKWKWKNEIAYKHICFFWFGFFFLAVDLVPFVAHHHAIARFARPTGRRYLNPGFLYLNYIFFLCSLTYILMLVAHNQNVCSSARCHFEMVAHRRRFSLIASQFLYSFASSLDVIFSFLFSVCYRTLWVKNVCSTSVRISYRVDYTLFIKSRSNRKWQNTQKRIKKWNKNRSSVEW